MKRLLIVSILLLAFASRLPAQTPENDLVFEQYQCRLVPKGNYRLLDESQIPGALAALVYDDGVVLMLMVRKAFPGARIDKTFLDEFANAFTRASGADKIEWQRNTFRGGPCHDLHSRKKDDGRINTLRLFAANGYFYQIQILNSPLPLEERSQLESLFSTFEYIGAPSFSPAAGAGQSTRPPGGNFAYRAGQLTGLLLLIALAYAAVKWAFRLATGRK